jgi:hypothetical protein
MTKEGKGWIREGWERSRVEGGGGGRRRWWAGAEVGGLLTVE